MDCELGPEGERVYALDSTFSLSACRSFSRRQAAVKMPRCSMGQHSDHPIADGKLDDVHALDHARSGSPDHLRSSRSWLVDFAGLYAVHQDRGLLRSRAVKSNIDAHRVYSAPTDRSNGIRCDQTSSLEALHAVSDYPERRRRIRFDDRAVRQDAGVITNNMLASCRLISLRALSKAAGCRCELPFKWIKQLLRIKQFYDCR